jgi:hypothetical protein
MKAPMNPYPRLKRPNRTRARGAAMVEGAVVIPVLCAFLGFFMFIKAGYDKRLDLQRETHKQTSQAALGSCAGDTPVFSTQCISGRASPPRSNSGVATQAPNANVSMRATSEYSSALSRSVSAYSYTLCDEKPLGGTGSVLTNLADWARYAGDKIVSAVTPVTNIPGEETRCE